MAPAGLASDKNLRWPTADKKRSWSAKSAACLGGFRGQRRTGTVIRGHNPVALVACSPRSPSGLAAYRGQRRTNGEEGSRGARRGRRGKRGQSSVGSSQ